MRATVAAYLVEVVCGPGLSRSRKAVFGLDAFHLLFLMRRYYLWQNVLKLWKKPS